jgi:hypothetical protein
MQKRMWALKKGKMDSAITPGCSLIAAPFKNFL